VVRRYQQRRHRGTGHYQLPVRHQYLSLAGQGIANIAMMGASGSNGAQTFYGQATAASLPYSVIGYASWEAATAGSLIITAGAWITPSRAETYRPGVALPGHLVRPVRGPRLASAPAQATTPFLIPRRPAAVARARRRRMF